MTTAQETYYEEQPPEVVVEHYKDRAYIFITEDAEQIDDGEKTSWKAMLYQGTVPYYENLENDILKDKQAWIDLIKGE